METELNTLREEVSNLLKNKLQLNYPSILSTLDPSQFTSAISSLRVRLNQLEVENVQLVKSNVYYKQQCENAQQQLSQKELQLTASEKAISRQIEVNEQNKLYKDLYTQSLEEARKLAAQITQLQQMRTELLGQQQFNQVAVGCEQNDQFVLQMKQSMLEKQNNQLRREKDDILQQYNSLKTEMSEMAKLKQQFRGSANDSLDLLQLRKENDQLKAENEQFQNICQQLKPADINQLQLDNQQLHSELDSMSIYQNQVKYNQDELLKAQKQLSDAQQQYKILQQQNEELINKNEESAQQNQQLQSSNDQLQEQLNQLQSKTDSTFKEIFQLRKALKESENQLILVNTQNSAQNLSQLNQSILEEKQALIELMQGGHLENKE